MMHSHYYVVADETEVEVLILVVMDDALAHLSCFAMLKSSQS